MSKIENLTHVDLPDALVSELGRWKEKYSNAVAVFNFVWLQPTMAVGVFGDGEMGAYEWFVWKDGKFSETSQMGYGNPAGALRDVLEREWPA